MDSIADNLLKIRQQIIIAEQRHNRQPGSVELLAVSKGQSVSAIEAAFQAGQQAFGESYLQEFLSKNQILADKKYKISWHFLGRIQTNKIKAIASYFDWVHSLDNFHHAELLAKFRESSQTPLSVCIQVNIDNEPTKNGVSLSNLANLALEIAKLPKIKLRGLMAIPAFSDNLLEQRKPFRELKIVFEKLQKSGLNLDTLSMGMTDDFEAGIAEGSTIVRIGTGIFGQRS